MRGCFEKGWWHEMFLLLYLIGFSLYVGMAAGVTVLLVKLARRMEAKRWIQVSLTILPVATFALIPTWDIPIAEQELSSSVKWRRE